MFKPRNKRVNIKLVSLTYFPKKQTFLYKFPCH